MKIINDQPTKFNLFPKFIIFKQEKIYPLTNVTLVTICHDRMIFTRNVSGIDWVEFRLILNLIQLNLINFIFF